MIVVLRSFKEEAMGGPSWQVREAETACAMRVAGVPWEQWVFSDLDPDWTRVGNAISKVVRDADLIIGPAYELGGHEHHNALAVALGGYVTDDDIRYLSYVRGHGRSEGIEVKPTFDEWEAKQAALACYASQAAYPPTAPWFDLADQREFVV